jgi:hypothetical protein
VIRTALLASILVAPPLTGIFAPIASVVALAVPTAVLQLDHALPAGACCTTYFPFVLLTALLAGPIYASLVGIASAGLADALFMGPRYQLLETPMSDFGVVASLISFALIIGCISLYRWIIARNARTEVRSASGVIFSLEDGVALASLPGGRRVPLGPEHEVADMMRDFLAQCEVADRLLQRPSR